MILFFDRWDQSSFKIYSNTYASFVYLYISWEVDKNEKMSYPLKENNSSLKYLAFTQNEGYCPDGIKTFI